MTRSLVLAAAGAIALFTAAAAHATTPSPNTGSLGSAADGTNADSVTFGTGVATGGGTDQAAVYTGAAGSDTVVSSFQTALNPPTASPFTVEFWANPTASDNDDAPVSNRVASGNRSGWIFFQRDAANGWNFRMYNGNGPALGWDLTGGTAPLNQWSHVVATWDGSAAKLYVNGQLADDTNSGAGGYNSSSSAPFTVAANDAGTSAYTGAVDETAFYGSALSPAQILAHFNAVSSPVEGSYQQLVRTDGALLQLSNNAVPEPSSIALLGGAGGLLVRRRRRGGA